MNIQEIMEIPDISKRIALLAEKDEMDKNYARWDREYKGNHAVIRDPSRKKYEATDEEGNKYFVKPSIIILKLQKKIVEFAKIFLFGRAVKLINNTEAESETEELRLGYGS